MGRPGKSNKPAMISNLCRAILGWRDVPFRRPKSATRMGGSLIFFKDPPAVLARRHRRDCLDAAGIPENT